MNDELKARYDRIEWRGERLKDLDSIKDDEWVEIGNDPPFQFQSEIFEAYKEESQKHGTLTHLQVTDIYNRIYEANGLPSIDHLTALGLLNQMTYSTHTCGEFICHTDDETVYTCCDCGLLDFSEWKIAGSCFEEKQRIFYPYLIEVRPPIDLEHHPIDEDLLKRAKEQGLTMAELRTIEGK